MATERKPQQPEQDDTPARETRQGDERLPPKPGEAKEDGMPGYGQPDPEVREEGLPDQKW
ncbi:hypothetical protein [Corallococcus terminator]|uniref:Uncharacterized protein n=1 Tax=Corallococcus terminator TaxID=2316733 RepID=A0A3A8JIJ4_9BACT|nr:hypothetical protein [Corallococcus terminator]RKG92154.1 hypothetical protein D7V88_07285 [Corallococcus terminator]